MMDYITEVDNLETEIDINLSDYYRTRDVKYLNAASYLNYQLEELRRLHDEGTI